MADGQAFGLFTPQTGQKVSRFGAALGGRLPEFDTRAEARQERLSTERKRAFLLDNRSALRMLKGGNVSGATQLLRNRIGEIDRLGGDPTQTAGILSMLETGDVAGVTAGLEQIDARAVDEGIFEPLVTGKSVEQQRLDLAREKFEAQQAGTGQEAQVVVKASEILPNGTVIQSTSAGVRVFDAQGNLLSGNDVVDAIEAGRRLGIRVAGDTAAAKAEADKVKQSIRVSGEMFKQVGPIRQSLLTIAKARQALAEGAETGVIDKLLPDVRESSIKLTNLMNQLGLEVISGTTFGALSAGELRLALDTALPTGLQPEALDRWLLDKGRAQTRLLDELNSDIVALSNGATIASLVERREDQARRFDESPTQPGAPKKPSAIKFLGFE